MFLRVLIGYSISAYPALFNHYSLIPLQFLRESDAKLAEVASKMPSRFAALTNKEISQIIRQDVPEIHEECDEVRFGDFNK